MNRHIQMDKRKDKTYIPLGINARGIIRKERNNSINSNLLNFSNKLEIKTTKIKFITGFLAILQTRKRETRANKVIYANKMR